MSVKPDPLDHDVIRGKLLTLRFLDTVNPCDREFWNYLKRHDADIDKIDRAGPLGCFPVVFTDDGSFEWNELGEAAVVQIVEHADGETPVDLLGWSMAAPCRWATFRGVGALLGADQIHLPGCRLWQTPLGWLRAECQGACILDFEVAAAVIAEARGPFIAQDTAHAHELIRLLPGVFGARGRLLVERGTAA